MADRLQKENVTYVAFLDPELPESEFHPGPALRVAAPAADGSMPAAARMPGESVATQYAHRLEHGRQRRRLAAGGHRGRAERRPDRLRLRPRRADDHAH